MNKRIKVISIILSFIYSIILIIGTSFKMGNSLKFIKNNFFLNLIVFLILTYTFYIIIIKIIKKLERYEDKKSKSKILIFFDRKVFIFSLIFIIVCWLPYIISFYPTILSRDPSFQIKQFFNIPSKYSTYNIMLDPNQLITNHHPVIHTLLLGFCLKLGMFINNCNLGLFLYSIIQILILSLTLSYTIYYLKKQGVSSKYRFIILLIYALTPVFPFYAISCVKDVIFTSLAILYIIVLFDLLKRKSNILLMDILKYLLIMILIVLFRNNGIYVILFSFPFLLFAVKREWKKLLIIFITIVCFNTCYNKIMLPYFKITPGSIREVLSIPFQQTARYISNYETTKYEKDKINKILDYNKIKKSYNPELSDPVKNTFKIYYTKNDMKNYFKVWGKGLIKHPICYIESTINNSYGYFYPFKTNWYFYYKYNSIIVKDGFDYHYNKLESSRDVLSNIGILFPYIPILGLIVNIGFNTWVIIFILFYLVYKKMYKYIIFLLPSFISLLVCIASPANTYFRYAMPIVFSNSLVIGLFISIIKERRKL